MRDITCNHCGVVVWANVDEWFVASAMCKRCEAELRPQWEARMAKLRAGEKPETMPLYTYAELRAAIDADPLLKAIVEERIEFLNWFKRGIAVPASKYKITKR